MDWAIVSIRIYGEVALAINSRLFANSPAIDERPQRVSIPEHDVDFAAQRIFEGMGQQTPHRITRGQGDPIHVKRSPKFAGSDYALAII